MIQLRKKDYLQRIIEEFFSHLHQLKKGSKDYNKEGNIILAQSFVFFYENFGVRQDDLLSDTVQKLNDILLLEQYAKLLFAKYEIVDIKDTAALQSALDIILYVESIDNTFSWDRAIFKEDLLRLLDM